MFAGEGGETTFIANAVEAAQRATRSPIPMIGPLSGVGSVRNEQTPEVLTSKLIMHLPC
jgi:hypothetical protein